MSAVATSDTPVTDEILLYSRNIAPSELAALYPDISEVNRDLYCQAISLVEAAHAVISAIADNSYEGAPLPHIRINQLRSDVLRMSAEISNILASRL